MGKFIQQGSDAPKIDKRHRIGSSEWLAGGQWVKGKSSNVAGLRYEMKTASLLVEFKSGSVYIYYNVPPQVAKGFFHAGSLGKYLDKHIKKAGYQYKKLV